MDGKALNEVSGPDAPLSLSIMKPELVMKEVCRYCEHGHENKTCSACHEDQHKHLACDIITNTHF